MARFRTATEPRHAPRRSRALNGASSAAALLAGILWPSIAGAVPTQQDVFRSIEQNVGESGDAGLLLATLCIVIGIAALVALLSRRQKIRSEPKPLNHQGKLLKEVTRIIGMKPSESKRLKSLLPAASDRAGQQVQSPLTLLLCPSLLSSAMKDAKTRK
jgi:MFS family permease